MTFQTNKSKQNNRVKKNEKNLENEVRSIWLGMRDSNPRMLEPKSSALPLGEPPISVLVYII